MNVLVGCPVRRREWIIDGWVAFVDAACRFAHLDHEIVFVADPADPTISVAAEAAGPDRSPCVVACEEPADGEDVRDWQTRARFERMVELRNQLLGEVRRQAPDLFLSLDSDILLHERALAGMVESLGRGWGAVGAKTYLTRSGTRVPNYATLLGQGGMLRPDSAGTFAVDAIMAVKLMTPAAYNVDYAWHRHGEDVGWCRNVRRAGLKLGWDGRFPSKHVMDRSTLDVVDARCGY